VTHFSFNVVVIDPLLMDNLSSLSFLFVLEQIHSIIHLIHQISFLASEIHHLLLQFFSVQIIISKVFLHFIDLEFFLFEYLHSFQFDFLLFL